MVRDFCALCRMIKIEHSVFALPFAYSGAFLGAEGWPGFRVLFWVTLAMVAVRSFAMTVNRIVDLRYDGLNPRTQHRELVTGEISLGQAWLFVFFTMAVFVFACWGLNTLCLYLSPLALLIAGGYSLAKRFTWMCHFVLGVTLGLAPLAGWIGVTAALGIVPVLLFWAVVFWVAGFDILYALQDTDFDRSSGLFSIPARFGLREALHLSFFCHANTVIFLFLFGYAGGLSLAWYFVWGGVGLVLLWEHRILSPGNLQKINIAFFTLNGVISLLVFIGVVLGIYIR